MVRNAVLKKLAVAAVIAVGVFSAPALAQADVPAQWTVGGAPVTTTTSVTMSGTLTLTNPATGISITCQAAGGGTVGPSGESSITTFAWSTPCLTALEGCTMASATVETAPWGLPLPWASRLTRIGSTFTDTISDLSFEWHFADVPACGTARNLVLHFLGSIGGTIDQSVTPTRVAFSGTGGLVSLELGPWTISGFYSLAGPAGAKVAAIP